MVSLSCVRIFRLRVLLAGRSRDKYEIPDIRQLRYARANPYFSGISKFANKGSFTAFRYSALESEVKGNCWSWGQLGEHILALKIRYSKERYNDDVSSAEYYKIFLCAKEEVDVCHASWAWGLRRTPRVCCVKKNGSNFNLYSGSRSHFLTYIAFNQVHT